ncbi:hypothetical protein CQA78_30975, partial [Klebsiella pneumoniae]
SLTGESLPVEKVARSRDSAASKTRWSATPLCFMGTNVVSGSLTGESLPVEKVARSRDSAASKTRWSATPLCF